ncbi:MAG: protein-export chaperone SecB [Fusobacteriaceae bacterium]
MSEATLKFLGYDLEKINYERNNLFDSSIDSEILPKINTMIIYKDESKKEANIILGIKYDNENNLPFSLEVVLRGFFEFNDEDQKIIFQNGTAIMYPYMRSIITDITSKTNYTPIILPTMNFYNLLSKELENYELISEGYLSYDE